MVTQSASSIAARNAAWFTYNILIEIAIYYTHLFENQEMNLYRNLILITHFEISELVLRKNLLQANQKIHN